MMDSEHSLQDQIEFLLDQYRSGSVENIHDLMKLIEMAYSDYIDFHPLEKEKYYDSRRP